MEGVRVASETIVEARVKTMGHRFGKRCVFHGPLSCSAE